MFLGIITAMKNKGEKINCTSLEKHLLDIVTD